MSRLPVSERELLPARSDSFWDSVKRKLAPLDSDDLVAAAVRRTHLDDFGDPPCGDALRVLVNACDTEAGLNLFGRLAARQHLLDLLETRLKLVDYFTGGGHRRSANSRSTDRSLLPACRGAVPPSFTACWRKIGATASR